MNITQPEFIGMNMNNFNVTEVFNNFKQNKKDLILIIMPTRGPVYADIKKAGDVAFGIATQVVLGKNIAKSGEKGKGPMNQLASNILLKINAKLGGTHSRVA